MSSPSAAGLKLADTTSTHTSELRRLSTFLEISQTLAAASNQKTALHQVLGILERHHGVVRSTIALLTENDGDIEVVAAAGPPGGGSNAGHPNGHPTVQSPRGGGPGAAAALGAPAAAAAQIPDSKTHATFRAGEGITGRVVQSGKPIVVPRVSREPMFLRRTSERPELASHEITYICVPILLNRKAIGALGADFRFKADRDFDRTVKFLGVVASLVAQAVRIQRAIDSERDRLREENTHLRLELRERYDFSNILGTSGPMRIVYEQVAQVARTDTTVLIRGESGTGKELVAQAIHYNSTRAKRPFIKVSCAALPESLIESELFGYEKGAFTGAHTSKKGRFELADGGTLFLDEIGELNLTIQIKLLRVLQAREFERLGGTKTIRANVRLIAATNKDIEKAIAEGAFREDLYYRLNVFAIFIPPLRERKPDLLLLADHFLEKASLAHGKHIKRISTPAIDMLMGYHWPGNVRELENAVERAVVVCDGQVVHAHHLPPTLQTAAGSSGTAMSLSLKDAIAAFEKDLIQDALKTSRGNRAKAARLLNTTGRIMNYKVRQLGIDWRRFRQ